MLGVPAHLLHYWVDATHTHFCQGNTDYKVTEYLRPSLKMMFSDSVRGLQFILTFSKQHSRRKASSWIWRWILRVIWSMAGRGFSIVQSMLYNHGHLSWSHCSKVSQGPQFSCLFNWQHGGFVFHFSFSFFNLCVVVVVRDRVSLCCPG
jgi:hypothetical protein